MGINLVYGFAVPGIDNAGHIGGAITGLVIALSISIAYQQRTRALQASMVNYQTNYRSHSYNDNISNHVNDDINDGSSDEINTIYADTDSNIPVDLHNNISANKDYGKDLNTQNVTAAVMKPAVIWQILPWITMLLVTIGFIWWWQDIHNQIIQVLEAIE